MIYFESDFFKGKHFPRESNPINFASSTFADSEVSILYLDQTKPAGNKQLKLNGSKRFVIDDDFKKFVLTIS